MANITVKNIPDELYERLKNVAHLRHRNINNEIIRSIEKVLGVSESDLDMEELRAMAREFHKKVKGTFTLEEMQGVINSGRP